MSAAPMVISLPIDDRQRSFDFYRAALGLVAIGPPAEDGVPEPLQFELRTGVNLMLVPRDGFGWVIGDHVVAERGESECLMSYSLASERDVDDLVERAVAAGATIVCEPGRQPWGYVGTFADPDGHLWMAEAIQT